jgi:hypothetical protein
MLFLLIFVWVFIKFGPAEDLTRFLNTLTFREQESAKIVYDVKDVGERAGWYLFYNRGGL